MSRKAIWRAECTHRRCSKTVVYSELGCHARCQGCGALGPGCLNSEAARQAFLLPEHAYGAPHTGNG